MRFYGLALAMSAFVLGACGGGDSAATTDTAAPAAVDAAPAGGAPSAGAAAAAAVTGTVHEIRMVGDAQGFRYEPANVTVAPGDGVKFIMVSGAPHNVSFQNVPDAARAQLDANIPAGKYDFTCIPHQPMGMNGSITVQ